MNNLCPTFEDLSPELQKIYPTLFNPLTILDLTIRNRVFISSHATMLAEQYAPGDRLIATRRITDLYEKQGSTGPLIFTVRTLNITNEAGEPVLDEIQTSINR